ncbi:universal stress protein [Spirosoma foliorum]|uniref:Universal stress protein n=1 Tax=Spirosoma foliorum TaxID=2710596 RepID=A0A7G5GQ92_9BACT|nr:universal stress protein [Spirosoma foliorum]QMW01034.1 universal stress protein [Spirosoma foliorum]
MKTILLATDFSANAKQAAYFAANLAKENKAQLILFHAFHLWPDNPAKEGDFPLSIKAMQESNEKALNHLANEIQNKVHPDKPIQCIVREGHTMNAIREATKTVHADLLVMSTVGTAPASAQLMGSIATGMVSETNVPLLLIPPGVGYAQLKNIVLCIDLNQPPDSVAMETALTLTRTFGCVINVLCVSEFPADEELKERAENIRRLLIPQPHTLSIVTGDELYDTLLQFAHTNKADLIMMLPQYRNWFQKLFSEGETQRIARLTDIPLLAVV